LPQLNMLSKLTGLLAAILLCAGSLYAQGARITSDPIAISGSGRPIGGANVAVCQPMATTAATANGSLLVFTMSSNPQTAGFAAGGILLVSGFTGGDTVFNAGSITGNVIVNGLTVLAVSPTTITVATSLTHVAVSNGTILQMGNANLSCAGLSTLYTDASLSTTTTNPIQTDGLGNYGAGIAGGTYYAQIYGPTVTTSIRQFVSSGGVGTIASTQVAFGNGSGITSSPNFTWDNINNVLNLNTIALGGTGCTAAVIQFTNSNGGSTPGCLSKLSDNSLILRNDAGVSPTHGYLSFDTNSSFTVISGFNGPTLFMNTIAGTQPAGSVRFDLSTALGLGKFRLQSGAPNNSATEWNSQNGCWSVLGSTSGSASWCPAALQGTPNPIQFPTTTGSTDQVLRTDGGSPQQLSWVTRSQAAVHYCGATSGAAQACAQTNEVLPIIVFGDLQLNAATTQTLSGLTFTSAASYSCTGSDLTTAAGVISFNTYAAASVVVQEAGGANTDHIRYQCVGF
jgi:hypothetical protein